MSTHHDDWQCGAPTPEGPCTWPVVWGVCLGLDADRGGRHEHDPRDVDPATCPCHSCREGRGEPRPPRQG